jgi:hypothetical protein
MGFIEKFTEAYKEAESPTSFFYWGALSAIAAVVRKNIYINKRIYKLYPNLYVMFVAKSGMRKGYPIKQVQRLIEALEVTKVISGQSSIQAMIQELSRQYTLESGKIMKDAQGIIINDELDALLINDPQAQTLLTTLYDSFYHKNWSKNIKKDGKETLKDLYVCMLTGTNPVHLDNFLDSTSVTGGFLGRTIIVYEEKKSRINPLIEENDATEVDIKPLLVLLEAISKIVGQFKFTPEAIKFYKAWYIDFFKRLESSEIDDDTGTAERAGDTSLKLSMLLSVNDGNSLLIEKSHIEKAVELFYESSRASKLVTAGKGKSSDADKVRVFIGYLLARPDYAAYKKQILAAKYGDLSAVDLAGVVDTLEQAGLIETLIDKQDGPLYKLNDKYAEKMKAKG